MSIKLMSSVFSDPHLNSVEKIVLLALADAANDEGTCYPSYDTMLLKTGLKSRSTLSKTLENLQARGYLKRHSRAAFGTGKQTTRYDLAISPPNGLIHPKVHDTDLSPISPRRGPSISPRRGLEPKSTKSSNRENNNTRACAREAALPPWLSETLWQAFLEHRRKLRAPMTLKAQELAIAKLERFRNAGIDPAATIEASIENGWKGLFEPKQHNTPRSGISEWLSRQTEADEREITGERIA